MKVQFDNQSHVSENQKRLLMRNLKTITEGKNYLEVKFTHIDRNQWSYQFIDNNRGFDTTIQYGSISIGI